MLEKERQNHSILLVRVLGKADKRDFAIVKDNVRSIVDGHMVYVKTQEMFQSKYSKIQDQIQSSIVRTIIIIYEVYQSLKAAIFEHFLRFFLCIMCEKFEDF